MASNATIVRRLRRAPDKDAARTLVRNLTLAELEAVACWVAERWTIRPVSGEDPSAFGAVPNLDSGLDEGPQNRLLTGRERFRAGNREYGPDPHERGRARPDPVSVLSTNLRRRRQALGLTQEQVADAGMMDTSYYSRVERGRIDPGVRTLTRIARGLETTPAALLEGVE